MWTIIYHVIFCFWLLKRVVTIEVSDNQGECQQLLHVNNGRLVYTRDQLLSYNVPSMPSQTDIPDEIKRSTRRRGRRGGIRARCRRRGPRLAVPMIVTGNVRSLRNKTDELSALCKWNYAYRESSMLCLTETWLQENRDPDSAFQIDGYNLVRGDRTAESGKQAGGGVCAYINERWCKNYFVLQKQCNKDIEFMTLSLRPFYLPREFNKVLVTIVYIPPDADARTAQNQLYEAINKTEENAPDAINIITGDFNHCNFRQCIPHYKQYIDFPTRDDKTLDFFYCNINSCYSAKRLKPLGISDHNMCLMLPCYRQKLKREKPVRKCLYQWNDATTETFIGCMELTDWDVLFDPAVSVDENVDVLNSYILFCTDVIVPKKQVVCYSNNKPWVTKELKELINQKKCLMSSNDKDALKTVQKDLDDMIKTCKLNYKDKVENLFKSDSKAAWDGLRKLTGMCKKKLSIDATNVKEFCDRLNLFYARFDEADFTTERLVIKQFLEEKNDNAICINENDIIRSLRRVKPGKAAGPDRISSQVVSICKQQLVPILHKIFQQSLDLCNVPTIWKTSEIVPAAKKTNPVCDNDYRPIALTSVIMKCLEYIVKQYLTTEVYQYRDLLQFAYVQNRCVEDAVLSVTDYILCHVDNVNTADCKRFVKVLFIDFSSAFNTIQPHTLMQKLNVMNVNSKLILWIHDFLTCRPQYVKLSEYCSDLIVTNTGAPQGCVLSPILFTMYTSDCKSSDVNSKLFKYADDTALVSLCNNNDDMYREEARNFTKWCEDNYLFLNVQKTKEMIIDFSKSQCHLPLYIKDEIVEVVNEYKYLGVTIDNTFTFSTHAQHTFKKAAKRMYFVRQLYKLNVDSKILNLFYSSVVQSILSFAITVWFGNSTGEAKGKIDKVINQCKKLGVTNSSDVLSLFKRALSQRCKVIRSDPDHPLHCKFQMLPSGKRLRSCKSRSARYNRSFIPSCIRIINNM